MRPDRRNFLLFLVCAAVLMLTGCATSSTTVVDEEVVSNPKPMATYKSLIINDFELKKEMISESPEERLSDRERRYSRIPAQLSESIERYAKSRHTYAIVSREGQLSATTLVLKGRFVRVGRFRISIIATLHDGASGAEVAYFRQTLWDVIDATESINLLGRDIADFIDRIQYK